MLDRLELMERRYEELTNLLSQPEVVVDIKQLQALSQERAKLEETIAKYREYKETSKKLEETQALLDDGAEPEMVTLIKEEINHLKQHQASLLQELKIALLPADPSEEKDVIVEIRGGTGGEEATLFAAELFRMYSRYAQAKGWQIEIIDSTRSEIGGFKEIIFEIKGRGAFSRLKYERGVHRVQRIPITEASGRIHTSTVTVAVLPEPEEIEIDINPDDLKIELFRSRGAGGQSVNKVTTAVRMTHLPTGIMASCQDERSQLRNKMKAMAVLRARLFDREQQRQQKEMTTERRSQIGTGERSEKVRTYNFPQTRVTDHRIDLSLHNLSQILDGQLDSLIDALTLNEQTKAITETSL